MSNKNRTIIEGTRKFNKVMLLSDSESNSPSETGHVSGGTSIETSSDMDFEVGISETSNSPKKFFSNNKIKKSSKQNTSISNSSNTKTNTKTKKTKTKKSLKKNINSSNNKTKRPLKSNTTNKNETDTDSYSNENENENGDENENEDDNYDIRG